MLTRPPWAIKVTKTTLEQLAEKAQVSISTVSRVLNGKAGVSADMALRLAEAFGTEASFWLKLQMQRDLWEASQRRRVTVKELPMLKAA